MTRAQFVLLLDLMIAEPEQVTPNQQRRLARFIRDQLHKINW